jgi:hypothetical protein
MNFFSRTKTDPASVLASIANKLSEARSQLAALEQRHGEVALAAELSGDNGKQLDELNSEAAVLRGRIENLERAEAEAVKQKAAADKMAAEAKRKAAVDALKDKLNARARPADKLRKLLPDVVQAFRELQKLSAEAQMLQPDGKLAPGFDPHDIQTLVSEELARLWEHPAIGETSRFPGSAMGHGHVYDPGSMKSLVEKIIDANNHAIKMAQS